MTDRGNVAFREAFASINSVVKAHPQAMTTPLSGRVLGSAVGTVWPTGHTSLATQLTRGGYVPQTSSVDPVVMPPAIAAYAIAAFTRPGDLVFDPDCGAGTTLVEALHGGRNTIGLAATPRAWEVARANVTAAKAAGAPVDGMVLVLRRRPNTLATAHAAGFTGRVDLILTTLRPRVTPPSADMVSGGIMRLRLLLAHARTLLRPGGHVVVTTAPYRDPHQPSELIDVPSLIIDAAATVGLVPRARCIALTGALHHGRHPWDARSRRGAAPTCATYRYPAAIPAHHTALVFTLAPPTAVATPRTAFQVAKRGTRRVRWRPRRTVLTHGATRTATRTQQVVACRPPADHQRIGDKPTPGVLAAATISASTAAATSTDAELSEPSASAA